MRQRRNNTSNADDDNTNNMENITIIDSDNSSILSLSFNTFKSSPKLQLTSFLWLLGLFVMLLAPAPVTLTDAQEANFASSVHKINTLPGLSEAMKAVYVAEAELDTVHVWGWRFRSPYDTLVPPKKQKLKNANEKLALLRTTQSEMMREAKSNVGIWSSYALEEMRLKFWDAYEAGKVFATRQTFWNMLTSALFSRTDENIVSLLLNWLFTALINFTVCLFGSLFYFAFSLFSLIWSYNPDPVSATAFYILGTIGAVSIVATYLISIYGMAASTLYVVASVAAKNARLEQGRRRDGIK